MQHTRRRPERRCRQRQHDSGRRRKEPSPSHRGKQHIAPLDRGTARVDARALIAGTGRDQSWPPEVALLTGPLSPGRASRRGRCRHGPVLAGQISADPCRITDFRLRPAWFALAGQASADPCRIKTCRHGAASAGNARTWNPVAPPGPGKQSLHLPGATNPARPWGGHRPNSLINLVGRQGFTSGRARETGAAKHAPHMSTAIPTIRNHPHEPPDSRRRGPLEAIRPLQPRGRCGAPRARSCPRARGGWPQTRMGTGLETVLASYRGCQAKPVTDHVCPAAPAPACRVRPQPVRELPSPAQLGPSNRAPRAPAGPSHPGGCGAGAARAVARARGCERYSAQPCGLAAVPAALRGRQTESGGREPVCAHPTKALGVRPQTSPSTA